MADGKAGSQHVHDYRTAVHRAFKCGYRCEEHTDWRDCHGVFPEYQGYPVGTVQEDCIQRPQTQGCQPPCERGAVCPRYIWRVHHRKAAGFPDHRNHVLFCHAVHGDALCAPYQRDYRRDQCHSFFRTLYRSGSKRLPDPDDKPHEVPVFSYIHPGTAAV